MAIAAPSMKAGLEAWGADSNLFHQGAAKESDDPDVIAATMSKPGVVLRRPVGSDGSFGEHAELPTNLGGGGRPTKAFRKSGSPRPTKPTSRPIDKAAERKAALAYEREQLGAGSMMTLTLSLMSGSRHSYLCYFLDAAGLCFSRTTNRGPSSMPCATTSRLARSFPLDRQRKLSAQSQ
jgi:hypothetical protein